ncbi:unnamed protein product [Psylliodes chrysocephalus]|uniref:Peroxidase n=1 Tax=Psylliodes chrysocephalus TaxID=3402493 RepID=A0A9P0G724_9CUCU|nr:unnamed protein product [Psylliodes chrysocephala]
MFKILTIFLVTCYAFGICDRECGLENIVCNDSAKFRSIDGSCNNLNNPIWGTSYSVYDRLLPPKYGDSMHSFPKALSGKRLPNARKMTTKIYSNFMPETISQISLSTMQYGNIVANDMSFTYLPSSNIDCCTENLQRLDKKDEPKECAPIQVPSDDPKFSFINATCISMTRTITNKEKNCSQSLKHNEQLNQVNSYLDLSIIYGNTHKDHKTIRSFQNGTLLVDIRNNYEWLPSTGSDKSLCEGNLNSDEICYRSGDKRTNMIPQQTLLQTLLVRNHNLIARNLQEINPSWNDDRLFEEARRINIAGHQFISYYEMLPLYLGTENLVNRKILYDTDGFVNDYDENMRPHILNEHAHAAFRQFHSLIAGKLSAYNPDGYSYDSLVLRDHLNRPAALEKYKLFDGLLRGLAMQNQMESDIYYDPEITQCAFLHRLRFRGDIKSLDIQRSRDHGIASYNDMRSYCGMKKAKQFNDFLDVMDQDKLDLLLPFYESPDDVDLIVGGSMERNVEGTLAGPTFLCILYEQFYRTRRSDRFWFENEANGLTLEQLKEIRKFSVSKLFCDNGNNITLMQRQGFLPVSERNPRISCKDIKGINLLLWKE